MTGLILKIDGIGNADAVEFYIERENTIRFTKDELVKVYRNNGVEYYALIDADRLGRGHLMCSVEFTDREAQWNRPVVVRGFTGYTIPCMGEGNTIACGDYVVSFKKENDIPKNDGTNIYYGTIGEPVGLSEITGAMLRGLNALPIEPAKLNVEVKKGDKVVVAIPKDQELEAYKDNGFGEAVKFGNSVMGANGEVEMENDDVRYKIYGEFVLVDGNIKIYIR